MTSIDPPEPPSAPHVDPGAPGLKTYHVSAGIPGSYIAIEVDIQAMNAEEASSTVKEFMTFVHEWGITPFRAYADAVESRGSTNGVAATFKRLAGWYANASEEERTRFREQSKDLGVTFKEDLTPDDFLRMAEASGD